MRTLFMTLNEINYFYSLAASFFGKVEIFMKCSSIPSFFSKSSVRFQTLIPAPISAKASVAS